MKLMIEMDEVDVDEAIRALRGRDCYLWSPEGPSEAVRDHEQDRELVLEKLRKALERGLGR